MAITVTAEQKDSVIELRWTTDDPSPVAGFTISIQIDPPNNTSVPLGTTEGENRLFVDEIDTPSLDGIVLEYVVSDLDTFTSGGVQITVFDSTPAAWTTIADVRTMLGTLESGFTDPQIQTAIEQATARLGSVFCIDVTVDDTTGLPTDPNVQTATTVMASRILVAPATGVAPVQGGQITSERMGSYSYSVRPGTAPSNAGPWTIDGVIKDLVGGYVCPGYAGIPTQTDTWPYDAPTGVVVEEVT